MRAAVIGAGMIGYYHVLGLKEAGADVVAIADPVEASRDRIADEFGIPKRAADYKELLKEDLDFITIGTPNNIHRDIAVDFLTAGKHVICDKPLARNLEEADAMISAGKKTGKRLFMALNHRFLPQNRLVGKLVQDGAIGRPFMAISTFIGNEYERMNNPNNWKGTWEGSGGGVIIDNGTHMIDIMRSWFGDVEAITAAAGTLAIEAKNKAEDSAALNLEFKSGVLASLTLTFGARYNTWPEGYMGAAIRTEILGLNGAITVGNLVPNFAVIKSNGERIEMPVSDIKSDITSNQFEHFMDCIKNDKEPIVTAEDGRAALAVVTAAYKSLKENRKVLLNEV